MAEFRGARAGDLPRLTRLWQAVFHDPEDFVTHFFAHYGPPERLLVACEEAQPVSMLALLPLSAQAGEERVSIPYVYALATDPGARGKGYARDLLRFAAGRAREMGAQGISTVPAEPSLHAFFASVGYAEQFAQRVWTVEGVDLPAGAGEAAPISPGGYEALRGRLLEDAPAAMWREEFLAFQRDISRRGKADLLRLSGPGWEGAAAVERWEDRVVVKELLAPPEALDAAQAVLAQAFPAPVYELRSPVWLPGPPHSRVVPFAMVDWFRPQPAFPRTAYFGLAFD